MVIEGDEIVKELAEALPNNYRVFQSTLGLKLGRNNISWEPCKSVVGSFSVIEIRYLNGVRYSLYKVLEALLPQEANSPRYQRSCTNRMKPHMQPRSS